MTIQIKKSCRAIFVAFLSIFITQSAVCQKNYLPGYIIRPNGDTLKGFIEFRNWETNPESIVFSEIQGGNKNSFGLRNIKEFGFHDEVYVSATVQTEVSPTSLGDLQTSSELNLETHTAFLQTIIRGEKSLYAYITKEGKEQFYISRDSVFELLIYKKYLRTVDGVTNVVENKGFVGQLYQYLKDDPGIMAALKNTHYTRRNLENLLLMYYKHIPSGFKSHKKTPGITPEIGLIAGLSITDLKLESDGFAYLTQAGYEPSYNFSAGFFVDIDFSRKSGRWSLCNDFIFTSYHVEGQYNDYESENQYTIYTTELGYAYLKMQNFVRYRFPLNSLSIYVKAGISTGFALQEINYKKEESKFYETERTEEGRAIDDTKTFEAGYAVGLGTSLKKFSVEVRFEQANGMSNYLALGSITNRIYLFLGYRF